MLFKGITMKHVITQLTVYIVFDLGKNSYSDRLNIRSREISGSYSETRPYTCLGARSSGNCSSKALRAVKHV